MDNINEYDSEPVFYCRECLSLCVVSMDGFDYCKDCGGTDIAMANDIFEWKRLYKEKYGK